VADRHQLAAFANLRTMIAAPEPDIHPWIYGISLALPNSRKFHRVKVHMGRSTRVSSELRLFFTIWRNIWVGIPGAPSVSPGYCPNFDTVLDRTPRPLRPEADDLAGVAHPPSFVAAST